MSQTPKVTQGRISSFKSIQALSQQSLTRSSSQVRYCGLDLATNTGISWADIGSQLGESPVYSGQLDLSLGPWDTHPIRAARFRAFLELINPDIVFFEDVVLASSASSSFVVGGATASTVITVLRTVLSTWGTDNDRVCEGRSISAIKKFATGRGNANKVDMIKEANKRYETALDPDEYERTGADNLADSLFLLEMATQAYPPAAMVAHLRRGEVWSPE